MKKRPPDTRAAAARPFATDIRSWLSKATPALLVIGVWALLHPYRGIVHDARLYAVQALRDLNPEIFDRDLFFAFGSQDEFTLFTRLFAPLVDAIGPSAAAMVIVGLGHALWLAGAAALAARLAPSRAGALAGLLLLACLPGSYGGWQAFAYGEGFATPRLLAEGFGLWAMWALSRGNIAAAGALLAASSLLHPIMCLATLPVALAFLIVRDRRWIAAGIAGALALAAAALLDIGPFGRLLETMDAEWLAIVQARNTYLFPGLWRASDWSHYAIALALAIAAAAVLSGWRRSLVLATAAAVSACLAASYVGADLMHNVLLIQLQHYRALWLLGVIGNLGAGILLVRLWVIREDGHALVAFLAFGTFLAFTMLPTIGTAVFALGLAVAVLRITGALRPLARSLQLACIWLAAVLALGLFAYRAASIWQMVQVTLPHGIGFLSASVLVTVIGVAILTVPLILLAWYRPAALRSALPALTLTVIASSLLLWDRRDPWTHAVWTRQAPAPSSWSLPSESTVFWENDAVNPWAILRRPSYVSATQGAGIAFARETALTFHRRVGVVLPLMQTEMIDIFRQPNGRDSALPEIDRATLTAVCARDPELGAMVLSRAVEGSYAAYWDTPLPYFNNWLAGQRFTQSPITRFYLYRCDELRIAQGVAGQPSGPLSEASR